MGFAETFKALSDPVRRDILTLLKKSGLVCETKEKNYIYYSLNISVVEEVMLWLAELKGESEDDEEK